MSVKAQRTEKDVIVTCGCGRMHRLPLVGGEARCACDAMHRYNGSALRTTYGEPSGPAPDGPALLDQRRRAPADKRRQRPI